LRRIGVELGHWRLPLISILLIRFSFWFNA
jgi:hypothetical protein